MSKVKSQGEAQDQRLNFGFASSCFRKISLRLQIEVNVIVEISSFSFSIENDD